jgi:NDP-sugar pyrophosphorylase family protein
MVLAAGRGVRMRPLTRARAKPSLPVLGVSLVGRVVRHLRGQGLEVIGANAFHGAESLAEALVRDASPAPDLFREPVLMGTGGALDAPRVRLGESEVFVVHNGDTLVDAELTPLVEAAGAPGCLGALLVSQPAVEGYTPLTVRGGRLVAVGRGDPSGETATYLGVAALRREVLEQVPRATPSGMFEDVLLPMMAESGTQLAVVPHEGRWLEFTSPESYRAALVRLLASEAGAEGRIPLPGGDAEVVREDRGHVFRAAGASCGRLRVRGGAVIEAGARIEEDCALEDSVVLEGAHLALGASVRRSVVDAEARVAAGEALESTVRAADGAPEPGAAGRGGRA